MLFHGADILMIALLALLIDRVFGELPFIRHPVILMGDAIKGFENHFYAPNIRRGLYLLLFMAVLVLVIGVLITLLITKLLANLSNEVNIILTAILASTLLAHRMLHDSVLRLLDTEHPQQALQMLVSRDTENLSQSDCYKAGIETYAENLSDGVIAPLFYLLLFGLPGILLYKAINTLDSMVGYRTEKYELYGKASAKLDDIVNWLPARITALLLRIVHFKSGIWAFYKQGQLHESPNAGHPITAMALNINCQLGGDTVYFGQLKKKAWFGRQDSPKNITRQHVMQSLAHRNKIDALLYSLLSVGIVLTFVVNH